MEIGELFSLLESNKSHVVEDIKKKFHELFNSCNPNDSWLVNGLFEYSMQTGSLRTVEILVGIREPHDTHLFNKFSECLRSNNKINGLTLLGHIVRRQPTWLFKITRHPLFRDLIKLLKTETEIIPLMSALLVINILLPMVAGLMEPYLQDLFQAFSHLAVWDTANPNKLLEGHLLHLQMALYALFLRLYGMYPCNFLSYLRQEYSQPHKLAIFSHTIKPMLDNVKMHPLLITASKDAEVAAIRWRRMEPHDVVVECAKFAIGGEFERGKEQDLKGEFDYCQTLEGTYQNSSGRDRTPWSPTCYTGVITPPESAPTSIPQTPIAQTHIVSTSFPQQEGTSPPEAAVEATPETTPIKDLRHVVRGVPPSNSSIPRALSTISSSSPSHSQPSSPMKKEASPFRFPPNSESSAFHQPVQDGRRDSLVNQKVQRLVTDRVQLINETSDSKIPKSRGVVQPASPLRVINGPPGWGNESPADILPADQEDREVEIMMMSDTDSLIWNPQQPDSVMQDISNDPDELEECQQESCTVGGICMPNSNSMRDFTRQVKSRLRFYSQCHADTPFQGLSPSDGCRVPVIAKVRRTNSCPEMKKTCSSLERHTVDKVEEEPSPLNGHNLEFPVVSSDDKKTVSIGTQTDNPLPYEHLFLAVFPTIEHTQQLSSEDTLSDPSNSSPLPHKRFSPTQVDNFMNTNVSSLSDPKKNRLQGKETPIIELELKTCKEQLLLMSLQLSFEKHRREMHAERNRRLLGKCRKVRSQEELTSALKDQVSLLQTDKEILHKDLYKKSEEAKAYVQQLQESVTHYQNENTVLQADYTKESSLRESVEQLLKKEREKTANVTKELNETKASLFNATNEFQQAANMANEGRDLKESIQNLQRELVIGGEVHERYRQRINSLLRHAQQSSEDSLLQESYSSQITALNQVIETQNAALEAALLRVGELDAVMNKTDTAMAESKHILELAKNEYHEQLQAVESKYNSLRAINSRLECELLELRHKIDTSQPEDNHPLLPQTQPEPFHILQNVFPDTSDADIHAPGTEHNG